MAGRDWNVTATGQPQACPTPRDWDLLQEVYRFYRFLADLDDALADDTREASDRLPAIRHLVRKLALNSYWLKTQIPEPCPKTGIAVRNLYDELGFPLTVQTVTFSPGAASNIHNHGTWGIVTILQGREKNAFWRRAGDRDFPDRVELVEEIVLAPGDTLSMTPDAIHSVVATSEEPLATFNVYGETNSRLRLEFDPETHRARNY